MSPRSSDALIHSIQFETSFARGVSLKWHFQLKKFPTKTNLWGFVLSVDFPPTLQILRYCFNKTVWN